MVELAGWWSILATVNENFLFNTYYHKLPIVIVVMAIMGPTVNIV